MKPRFLSQILSFFGFPLLLAAVGLAGCGPRPDYRHLTPAEMGDLRSSIGEKRLILDVAEYGPTIHVILEFPRNLEIRTVGSDCQQALYKIQEELRASDHSRRPVIVWGHSKPSDKGTFRLFGYAQTDSASAEVTWKSNVQADQELPVPQAR